MKLTAAVLITVSYGLSQTAVSTRGPCSPAISQTGVNVTITYQSGSCSELNPSTVAALKTFVKEYPRTVVRLNELLDKKDVELDDRANEVKTWIARYKELEERIRGQQSQDNLTQQALLALKDGDLDRAETLLNEMLAGEENAVDRAARTHFYLGQLYELRFQTSEALSAYASAYQYRPSEVDYAFRYGILLGKTGRDTEAEAILVSALPLARSRSKDDVDYLYVVAKIHEYLGFLYARTNRPQEALSAFDSLRKIGPIVTMKDGTIYFLQTEDSLSTVEAKLYTRLHQLDQAEKAYLDHVRLAREGERGSALVVLGRFYRDTQRWNEAEDTYLKALPIERSRLTPEALRSISIYDVRSWCQEASHNLIEIGNFFLDRRIDEMLRGPLAGPTARYLEKAEEAYTSALTFRAELLKTGNVVNVQYALEMLARVYSISDRQQDAETLKREAEALSKN